MDALFTTGYKESPMNHDAEQRLPALLALAPADRANLADCLWQSLEEAPEETDFDWLALWGPEIDRRCQQLDKGDARTVSRDEAMRFVREGR